MPTFRKLHTKVTQSFDFNEMPDDFTRCLWLLMPLGLDCDGRGIYNGSWIKAKIMPLREDVTSKDIMTAMEWFVARGMVIVYHVDDRAYFYIPTFKDYQSGTEKEAKSVLPTPLDPLLTNSRAGQVLLSTNSRVTQELVGVAASASASESESESEQEQFETVLSWVEKTTGRTADTHASVTAINELIKAGATLPDIQAGVKWHIENKGPIRYYSSLVGPVKTSISMRIQGVKDIGLSDLERAQRALYPEHFERH